MPIFEFERVLFPQQALCLAYISAKKLGVSGIFHTDELPAYGITIEEVTALLPGYNCGSCGFPGCSGLAEALVNGEVKSVQKEYTEPTKLLDEKGNLKSEDASYKAEMEQMVGTYPAKYNKDLINQFIESGKITAVDIVAGATESTGNFKTLIIEAMENASTGNTEVEIVENLK